MSFSIFLILFAVLVVCLVSFLSASLSISKRIVLRLAVSNSSGIFSREIFKVDADSSIKSIALSGRYLSVIYLELNLTDETIASSVILTP